MPEKDIDLDVATFDSLDTEGWFRSVLGSLPGNLRNMMSTVYMTTMALRKA